MILGFAQEWINDGKADEINDEIPSKMGGYPIWFGNGEMISAKDTKCGSCSSQMSMLLQLYAPDEEQDFAYHRVIYVFMCRNGSCTKTENLRVFRRQSYKHNDVIMNPMICKICGIKGDKACSNCHVARYCSKEHQIFDWTVGGHAKFCEYSNGVAAAVSDEAENTRKKLVFPEYQIVHVDEEQTEAAAAEEEIEMNSLALVQTKESSSGSTEQWKEEEFEDSSASCDIDKAFLRFQKQIQNAPDQIIRYLRDDSSTDDYPIPLWASDNDQPADIPACPNCQSRRSLEFQIMPQILNYLKLNNADPRSIDFGTILIYTCHRNCNLNSETEYQREFPWLQHFSTDGMGNEFKSLRFGFDSRKKN